jgi:hypothetical protein
LPGRRARGAARRRGRSWFSICASPRARSDEVESDRAPGFHSYRIFYGKPVRTLPENALAVDRIDIAETWHGSDVLPRRGHLGRPLAKIGLGKRMGAAGTNRRRIRLSRLIRPPAPTRRTPRRIAKRRNIKGRSSSGGLFMHGSGCRPQGAGARVFRGSSPSPGFTRTNSVPAVVA